MKKLISVLLVIMMLAGVLSGCGDTGKNNETVTEPNKNNKLSVVTTIFPVYDWVMQIIGNEAENAEVTMLLDNGVDLHSYQPTADDIIKISACDLFIYVGGESDEWVGAALSKATNKDMVVINLLEALGDAVKEEEAVEGMQETEHSHDEEISADDIKDRSLSEFTGAWRSLHPLVLSGALDAYLERLAAEDEDSETTKETYFDKYKTAWTCRAEEISVDGNSVTYTYQDGTSCSAEYTYAGYSIKKNEDGEIKSVRYQFETNSGNAPKYLQFNDHGYKPGEPEHFHVYFGNEGFEALMDSEFNPFFVPAEFSTDEIIESLTSHNHSHEDEHVWLSLKNAVAVCRVIKDALIRLAADNAGAYTENADVYIEKLNALDAQYKAAVDASGVKTVLFGDRFPFRYLVDDYSLDYYAAFSGCSAESEASFETIAFLAKKVDELGLSSVLTIENANHKIAQAVVSATTEKTARILSLDSMQSTTSGDAEGGKTYLSVMEKNLEVLKAALK